MTTNDLIGLVQIGLAVLIGVLSWRLITAVHTARQQALTPQGDRRMAEVDTPALFSTELIASAIKHMNDDHADAVLAYARELAGLPWADTATLTAIDRFGIELVATAAARTETTRILFDTALVDAAQLRPALIALARRAHTH